MNQALGSKWSEERIGHLHCPPRLSHSYQNTVSGYLWFRTNLHQWAGIQFGSCLDQRIQRKHYLTVQQSTVSEQKETRGLSCFCIRICIEFVQSRQAQNKAWSWPQFPVANWYFIPWLKHDAWQSEHCNEEVSQKSSVLPVKQCFTNVCSVSESEQIDCKTGSDFDWWPALGNPGFAQELCLCWAFAATLSAGPQLLELQDTVPPRLKCKSHSV